MKKTFTSLFITARVILAVLFIIFFSTVHGQVMSPMMKDTNFITYDPEIGNYRLKFEIKGIEPNFDFPPYIVLAGSGVELKSHFYFNFPTGKWWIELDEDAPLDLWQGEYYWFRHGYLGVDWVHQYDFTKLWAPKLNVDLTFMVKDSYLKASASISGAEKMFLYIDQRETYFSIMDNLIDSILYGSLDKITPRFVGNNKIEGEKFLSGIGTPEQFLNVLGTYTNQYN
ncbi:MAG: hypothetical protein M3P22_02390, partial [bacterium]|nr:hypothetical protein [bacterium]